jgi:hypothetical protein
VADPGRVSHSPSLAWFDVGDHHPASPHHHNRRELLAGLSLAQHGLVLAVSHQRWRHAQVIDRTMLDAAAVLLVELADLCTLLSTL